MLRRGEFANSTIAVFHGVDFYVEIILFLSVLSLVVSGLKLKNMDGLRDIWSFCFNV